MTKAQKIIVLAAASLIIISILYPPYLRIATLVHPSSGQETSSASERGWTWIFKTGGIEREPVTVDDVLVTRNELRFDILSLEIFGILVLAGAALLVTKKGK
jgi:hypothetical protein